MKKIQTLLYVLGIILLTDCSGLFPKTETDDESADETSETLPKQEPTAIELKPQIATPNPLEGRPMKKRLFVLQFLNKSRHGGDELSLHARDIVYNSLLGAQEFQLVPQQEVDGSEKFINDLGEYDFREIYDKLRAHNVSGVLGGAIDDVVIRETGDETGIFRSRTFAVVATLRLKLYDASTERELLSRLTSADVTEERTEFFNTRKISNYDPERGKVAVRKALEKVINVIPAYAKKIAWTGRIAKIDMHRYYITAGEMSGISKSQLLKVFEDGQPVYDPETKALVGISPGRFKGLLRVVDHFGEDGSVAVIHSGGGFRERDRVEIFSQLQN